MASSTDRASALSFLLNWTPCGPSTEYQARRGRCSPWLGACGLQCVVPSVECSGDYTVLLLTCGSLAMRRSDGFDVQEGIPKLYTAEYTVYGRGYSGTDVLSALGMYHDSGLLSGIDSRRLHGIVEDVAWPADDDLAEQELVRFLRRRGPCPGSEWAQGLLGTTTFRAGSELSSSRASRSGHLQRSY